MELWGCWVGCQPGKPPRSGAAARPSDGEFALSNDPDQLRQRTRTLVSNLCSFSRLVSHSAEAALTQGGGRSTELVGYARASIYERQQVFDQQVEALSTVGCARIFEDCRTAASIDRPGLRACLKHLQCNDVLVVLDLDRFGLLTGDMIRFVQELEGRGVGFWALNAALDTTTSAGRTFMQIYKCFTEMDRTVVRQRINEGFFETL